MYVLIIFGCCCALLLGSVVSVAVISDDIEGSPGDVFEISTVNYKQLPGSYYEMKNGTEEGDLSAYNMTEHTVYTFLLTVWGDNRTVRVVFQEYDLNPQSVLYVSVFQVT